MGDQATTAVGAQLERHVRPCVWMVRRHDAQAYWIPFLHEPVDALKDPEREVVRLHWPEDLAAERERCATVCDARSADHWADYKGHGTLPRGRAESEHASDEADACARAIRGAYA